MAREIALTQGKFTIVDDADYENVGRHKWRAKRSRGNPDMVYAIRTLRVDGRKHMCFMHRVILDARAGEIVDHVDPGATLDNRRSNLRLCTQAQNARNQRKLSKTMSSMYKGVSFNKRDGEWEAYITINRKRRRLGRYEFEKDAALAYDAAARRLHGEFARCNFPGDGDQKGPYLDERSVDFPSILDYEPSYKRGRHK